MITDNIVNASLYAGLGARFQRAFDYLQKTDLAALPVGRYELDGKNLYVLIQEYSTKLPGTGKWEAHQRYIDVQYIVHGAEKMGFAMLKRMQLGAYDAAKDFQAMSGDGDALVLQSGDFMVLWPNDGHMPGMAINASSPVKKAVVKIAIE
jgi:biofilm protein TabA